MPTIDEVKVADGDQALAITVVADTTPQSAPAVLWRYTPQKKPDGRVGDFRTGAPTISIATPSQLRDYYFLVEGAVLSQDDDPPTHYEVRMQMKQGSSLLLDKVIASGDIGKEDIPFAARFHLSNDR